VSVQKSPTVIADIEDLKRIVGENIRTAREALGMNQEMLANRVGAYNYQVIWNYERGRVMPKDERLIKIAIVLDRDLAWFFEPHLTQKNGRAA
jgi:transcriptional regulator with XRE-family HTH domain